MHCDLWTKLLLLSVLVGASRQYSIEELNSVILTLDLPLADYVNNVDGVKDAVYELITNVTTANCTLMKQDCKLVAKYPRASGSYKRTITVEDFNFTSEYITELKPPEVYQYPNGTLHPDYIRIVFNLQTYTGWDYLKWTELVRILYWWRHAFNEKFRERTGRSGDVMGDVPTSYIAEVIATNNTIPTVISCVMLGAALIMFIIVVPLSRTKYCRKELQEEEDNEETSAESNKKV